MPPLRRYIRLTKTRVLESRIYLDDPSLLSTWLLRARDPVLARVIRAVLPLVLPKLREEEENERSRRPSGKKKTIKDVVVKDDFEVSIFLTKTAIRHSILLRHRHLRDSRLGRLQSSSKRLTAGVGDDLDAPIYLGDDDGNDKADNNDKNDDVPGLRRESGDEDDGGGGALAALDSIPSLEEAAPPARRGKRARGDDDSPLEVVDLRRDDDDNEDAGEEDDDNDDDDGDDDDDGAGGGGGDDKKKLGMDLTYEGFAIYGMLLCLIIKKRETAGPAGAGAASAAKGQKGAPKTGQAIRENWIMSTQMPAEEK